MDNEYTKAYNRKLERAAADEMATWIKSLIPNGKFFTGTYRPSSRWLSDKTAFNDFKYVLRQAGYKGLFFVAFHGDADGGIHVHAILEDNAQISKITLFWLRSFGAYELGDARQGAYNYVATRGMAQDRYGNHRYRENFKTARTVKVSSR